MSKDQLLSSTARTVRRIHIVAEPTPAVRVCLQRPRYEVLAEYFDPQDIEFCNAINEISDRNAGWTK